MERCRRLQYECPDSTHCLSHRATRSCGHSKGAATFQDNTGRSACRGRPLLQPCSAARCWHRHGFGVLSFLNTEPARWRTSCLEWGAEVSLEPSQRTRSSRPPWLRPPFTACHVAAQPVASVPVRDGPNRPGPGVLGCALAAGPASRPGPATVLEYWRPVGSVVLLVMQCQWVGWDP